MAARTTVLYSGVRMNFFPLLPHLLSDLGDILQKKSPSNAVD